MIYIVTVARRPVLALVSLVALACAAASGPSTSGNGGGGGGVLPHFAHAVIVVEENHDFDQADSAHMPYLHSLMAQYGYATQYYANTHPSIGNYFVLTAGQIITNSDSYSATITEDNIVRHLVAAGKTWKSYAEDLPSVGYTGQKSGGYARKHNPLSFFSDVVNDSAQLRRLVPFTQFATDLAGDTLPNYAFVVPNLCNDAHDCGLDTADAWLQTNIAPLLASPSFQADGLLVIVFDEADSDNTHGGGRIVWTAISPKAKRGFTSATLYQHENTLRLMAEGLGLTSFPGAAANASNMAEFFTP
ncbi:MAG TPA: alkaline phosphatase family protein [Gemmatimonadales bacterium]